MTHEPSQHHKNKEPNRPQVIWTVSKADEEYFALIEEENRRNPHLGMSNHQMAVALLRQRLELLRAGWGIHDKTTGTILECIVRANEKRLESIKELFRRWVAEDAGTISSPSVKKRKR